MASDDKPPRQIEKRIKTDRQTRAPGLLGNYKLDLSDEVQLAGWPTTRSTDGDNGLRSPEGAEKEFARTGGGADLPTMAHLAGWGTPTARDYKDDGPAFAADPSIVKEGSRLPRQAAGLTPPSSPAGTARRVVSRLNPAFSLWLQGFPATWNLCSPGWSDWVTTERLLADFYGGPGATEAAG